MTVKAIKIISPENTSIVGALLDDGSTCKISLIYDRATAVLDTVFHHNGESELSKNNGEDIYIDENGKRWAASVVIDHSIFNSQV